MWLLPGERVPVAVLAALSLALVSAALAAVLGLHLRAERRFAALLRDAAGAQRQGPDGPGPNRAVSLAG